MTDRLEPIRQVAIDEQAHQVRAIAVEWYAERAGRWWANLEPNVAVIVRVLEVRQVPLSRHRCQLAERACQSRKQQ